MLVIDKKIGECEMLMNSGEYVKCDLYSCNALFAVVGGDRSLYLFYADLEHLKRCLGFRKNHNENIVKGFVRNFVFYGKGKTAFGTSYETIVLNLKKGGIAASIAA